jgi:hypothetical protein
MHTLILNLAYAIVTKAAARTKSSLSANSAAR